MKKSMIRFNDNINISLSNWFINFDRDSVSEVDEDY